MQKTLGPEHPKTATILQNLGVLFKDQDDLVGAQPLYERALEIREKSFGRDHPSTKDSAHVAADALDALGRTDEAKALRERYGLTPPEKPQSSESPHDDHGDHRRGSCRRHPLLPLAP